MEMPLSAVLGGSRKPRRASPRIRMGRLGREPGLTHAKAPIKLCSGPRPRCLPSASGGNQESAPASGAPGRCRQRSAQVITPVAAK